jgi:hypothetical protein
LFIDRLTNNVHNTAQSLTSDRDSDRGSSVDDSLATSETISGLHSNAADSLVTSVLGNLKNQPNVMALNFQSRENSGEFTIKVNIHDGTNNLQGKINKNKLIDEGEINKQVSMLKMV